MPRRYGVALLIASAVATNAQPPWRELHGPIRAVAWSAGPEDLANISTMIWVRNNTAPAEAAARSRELPEGRAAVFLWEMSRDLLKHPDDVCRTPEGEPTPYVGPWLEHGIAALKARAVAFFSAYKEAGGRLDFLVVDDESGLSMWHMRDHREEHCRAIQNDPRSGPLKAELGFDDFGGVIDWRSGKDYLTWNAVLGRYIDKALNEALFGPVAELFPAVKSSNYGSYSMTAENVVPDLHGHAQHRFGGCGTHGSRAFYGGIGQLAGRRLVGDQPYGNSPFATLRWELNKNPRDPPLSDMPFQAWISHKNYHDSRYRDNGYYEELLRHLALSGVQDFLYWNPDRWRDNQDPDHYRTDEHDRLVDALITELNEKLGEELRECVTPNPLPWDCELLATGMRSGDDRVLWRVTVPPDTRAVAITPGGETITLDGAIGFWHESTMAAETTFSLAE